MTKRFKSAGIAPILILFVFLMTVVVRVFDLTSGKTADEIFARTVVSQIVIFALPALFYCKTRSDSYFTNIPISTMQVSRVIFIFYALAVLVSGSMLIQYGVYAIGGSAYSVSTTGQEISAISRQSGFGYVFLALGLLPAICEEFVFRGILLYEYSQYGKFCAITFSSLAFAMLHFSLSGFLSYFFCGLVLGFSFYVTQNLLVNILLHLASNIFSIYVMPLVSQMILGAGNVFFMLFLIGAFFIFSLAMFFREASIVYWEYAVGDAKMKISNHDTKKGRTNGIYAISEVFLSPVFLICALLFIIMSLTL